MKNIELKNIYWESNEDKQIEIKQTLLKRPNHTKRVKSGNSDLLIHLIKPTQDNDTGIAVMVNGIFTLEELKNIIGRDIF